MSDKCKLTVSAGVRDLLNCIVSAELPWSYAECKAVKLCEKGSDRPIPCQVSKAPKGIILTWFMTRLKAGASQTLTVTAVADSGKPSVVVENVAGEYRVDVSAYGKLFTSYHYGRKCVRPFLYPVIGPYGTQVTRNWPMVDGVKGEHRDHVHHKSIWVAYGECDKVDNWSEEEGHGWQRHQGFLELVSGPVFGRIVAKNDWCAKNEKKQFEEIRDMRFYALPGGERLLDLAVTFRMTQNAVTFRDTKEGGIVSVRVASSMDVRNGGKIQNGYGGVNEAETWGKKAPWCDYSGLVGGKHVGLAILDHDKNPRYPTEWHVRDYGLMTANCFARMHYCPEDKVRGDMVFKKGSATTWRYRLYIHRGDANRAGVTARFLEFIAPPKVTVA